MKGLITLTHILSTLFFGMFIGGLIVGTDLWVTGLVLLIIDIVVGISLQHSYEKSVIDKYSSIIAEEDDEDINSIDIESDNFDFNDDQNEKTDNDEDNEKENDDKYSYESLINNLIRKMENCYGDGTLGYVKGINPLYEKDNVILQQNIYKDLQDNGAQLVDSVGDSEAGIFLRDLCLQMEHAPIPRTLMPLCAITPEDLGEEKAVVYSFRYHLSSYCENVFIFIVKTKDDILRFFTVETSCYKFMLCEYADSRHLNYGTVELKNVPARIKEILNN